MTLLPNSLRSLALTAITAVACSAQSTAPAAVTSSSRNYTRIDAGVSLVNNIDVGGSTLNFKAGPFAALAYGYKLSEQTAIEGEISHQENKLDTGAASGVVDAKVSGTSFLANSTFNISSGNNSRLSLGLGAGSTVLRYNITTRLFGRSFTDTDSEAYFTAQVRGKWQYQLAPNRDFVLGYRFKYIDADERVYAHTFTAGFSFSF